MYNFLFDKKSFYLLLGGLGLAGVLLFISGLLVGVQVGLPTTKVTYVPPRAPVKAALPEERPCTPCAELAAPPPEPLVPAVPEPEPEPEPVAPVVEEPRVQVASLALPSEDGAFSLQVGAFRQPENSDKVVRDLESRGYQPYVVPLKRSRSRLLHTVRVGRYADREEARKAAAELRQREGIAAIVIGS